MLIVQKLTEQTICETVDNLLAQEEFESIFSKNEAWFAWKIYNTRNVIHPCFSSMST